MRFIHIIIEHHNFTKLQYFVPNAHRKRRLGTTDISEAGLFALYVEVRFCC